jgi:tetratricopeptide (TPR) repeat protein
MEVAETSPSYERLLQQAAELAVGPALEQLISCCAAQRTSEPATAHLVALPEALALWRVGRAAHALELLLPAEELLEADAHYWILRGLVAKAMPDGQGEALCAYKRALALDPHRADLHYNLANALREIDPRAAEKGYRRSLALDPHQAACWHNLAALLLKHERPAEALVLLRISLCLDPTAANVWCDLGNCYQALDRLPSAQRSFLCAIGLDRTYAASYVNFGAALLHDLQPDQAIDALQRGLELDRSSADALWNLGLAHLQLGNFENGWQLYDARLRIPACQAGPAPTSGVTPQTLADCPAAGASPLVVWSEQGLGDAIQFCRYLPLLEAAGVPFEFHCRARLVRLLQTWTPLRDRVLPERLHAQAGDYRPQIPLLSLPRLFGTTLATIPSQLPYLQPPEPPPTHLQVPEPPGGLAVGLVWASEAGNRSMYRRKSIPLHLLMPRLVDLVDLDLIDLHCLQVGPDEAQLEPWRSKPRITSWAPHLHDFADTAHVVQQLDLVIAVDTAVAHLAGALQRPTWLLLPHSADFRWLQQRSDSPWYPGSMRLFRQPYPGDWPALVKELHAALDQLFLLDLEGLVADKLNR